MRTSLFLAALMLAPVAMADEGRPIGRVVQAVRPLHRHPTMFSMLQRNNRIRGRLGLRPHRINPQLTAAAQDHANYMARTGQFDHYANGGPQARANRYGFRGGVRENIAWNYGTVDQVFNGWTASSGHYASIVSQTSDAGFGYAVGRGGQTYWVGVYANPAQGDAIGETEAQVYAAYQEERRAIAERNVAQTQATEANATESNTTEANNTEANPAGNAEGNQQNPAGGNGEASNGAATSGQATEKPAEASASEPE